MINHPQFLNTQKLNLFLSRSAKSSGVNEDATSKVGELTGDFGVGVLANWRSK